MPIIAKFRGLKIAIQYNDRNPPHVHVFRGNEKLASVDIEKAEFINGENNVSNKEYKIICSWVATYEEALMDNWRRVLKHQDIITLPGV